MSYTGELNGQEIAVIGMAGRYPDAKDIDQFWKNLADGKESVSFWTDDELLAAGVDKNLISDENYVKLKGFILDDWDLFDARFFGYTPTEAELMDPQIRIFHECAWGALENAGYNSESYEGLIGVYAGASSHFYWTYTSMLSEKSSEIGQESTFFLTDKDYLSSRIAYKLDLKGPCMVTQTTCSTSLVTIHLACQAILGGECDMAIAGGVSIDAQDKFGYLSQEDAAYSSDGHIRAFDADASGTLLGNGVGIVVLKLLEEAIADGDHIYAVIKSTAVNNDGFNKANYIAPSVDGQKKVIKLAHEIAEIEPESIGYIEAHGTGTILGDPIEIEALKQAFDTEKRGYCAIGAVKTNIGHLNAAAGVAAVTKTILALQNRLIPPSLNYKHPNPAIDFQNSPFYVNTELKPWEKNGHPLRAGVSAFGIGGTNAHMILEEPPQREDSSESRPYQILTISAKTPTALDKTVKNLEAYLKKNPDVNLADAFYTMKVGRGNFIHRKYLICNGKDDALQILSELNHIPPYTAGEIDRPVIFMFSGQGSQYLNMGLDLYKTETRFRNEMDRCFELLEPVMGENIKHILFPVDHGESTKDRIRDVIYSAPVKFIFEYCLARLMMRWGIKPHAMIGHSLGEYTAACISGVFSLEDALSLVVLRAKLMESVAEGGMMSVPLSEKELAPLLDDSLSIAAINTPTSCIVSGTNENILRFKRMVEAKGHECLQFKVSRAGHSMMMDSILKDFEEGVRNVRLNKPRIPYISNISGQWITTKEATDPEYWARHIRKTVRYADGLKELLKIQHAIFVQIGSDRGPTAFVSQQESFTDSNQAINLVRHPKEDISDSFYLLDKIGLLWLWGIKIDWQAFYAEEKRHRIPLPTYPFEGNRYRIDSKDIHTNLNAFKNQLTQNNNDLSNMFYIPSWIRSALPICENNEISVGNCLIFNDDCGLGGQLASGLQDRGAQVVFIKPGDRFLKVSENEYELNPELPNDYHQLIESIHQDKRKINHIVHLWRISGEDDKKADYYSIDFELNLGFYSLIFLAQSLGNYDINSELHIDVITNNMQEVTGDDLLYPEKATILGPVKIIQAEYENITCRSIDVAFSELSIHGRKKLTHKLVQEITRKSAEQIVSYRGNYRWTQFFKPVLLEKINPDKPNQLRSKGVYLIIGGLGQVGMILSELLSKTVQAKLILLQRSPFPDRKDWDQWLKDHDDKDSISIKINKLLHMEGYGAEVLILRADVSDMKEVQEAVHRSKERFGQINGVLHCAMSPGGSMIQRRTREDIEMGFASKVKGTLALEKVLEDADLDMFMVCSSMSSVLPIIGQVEYCAANAFLDAFVHYKTSHSETFATAMNWNFWKDTELLGQTVEVMNLRDNSISTTQGVEAFLRILESNETQVLVSTEDIMKMIENFSKDGLMQLQDVSKGFTHSGQIPSHYRKNIPYMAPSNTTEEALANIWQSFLGYDKIGIHDDFFSLGGDSLKALQLISRIRKAFDRKLSIANFFKYPTIEQLASYLASDKDYIYQPIHCLSKSTAFKELSLVCVPYAAGGTSTYIRLSEEIAKINDQICVYTVELPGNDFGADNAQKKEVGILAKECVEQIKREVSSPIAIYGHCGGSFVALEICRLLEKENMDVLLFGIGGALVTLTNDQIDPEVMLNYTEEEMQHVFSGLGAFKNGEGDIGDEEFNFISNNLQQDSHIIYKHLKKMQRDEAKYKIQAPIYNIISDNDLTTDGYKTLYKNWHQYSDNVELIEINGGGHYFVNEEVVQLAKILTDLILNTGV
ncbi:MAG: acyltransferase domain-containing protein [Proteobacteria bacterium]|nr:acyltransferase domain-containing protein [Pseudomonadota bacterium]